MADLDRRAFLGRAVLGVASAGAALWLSRGLLSPDGPEASGAASVVRSASTDWQREWDELTVAAQREGALSLVTWGDRPYHATIAAFTAAFPGIAVEQYAESNAPTWLERARQRRRAGNTFDIALVQPDRALQDGAPEGMWAPLRPLLFRPDVTDSAVWRDGFAARFLDLDGTRCFDWQHQVFHSYAVHRDLVPDGAITSVRDLLDPRWRGRVLTSDPRIGIALNAAAAVAMHHDRDVLRRLLVDQRPMRSPGGVHLAQELVSGRVPIVLGLRPKALEEFRDRGADRVSFLDLPDVDFVPSTAMLAFERSSHPAAARLFANWFLTREAQEIVGRTMPVNSARLDVPVFELIDVGAGTGYYDPDREANYGQLADVGRFVRDALS